MRSLGFALAGFAPFFFDVRTGRLLQADGVFFRVAGTVPSSGDTSL